MEEKGSITAREMGLRSAEARMIKLTPEQRSEIARQAVSKRWSRLSKEQRMAQGRMLAERRKHKSHDIPALNAWEVELEQFAKLLDQGKPIPPTAYLNCPICGTNYNVSAQIADGLPRYGSRCNDLSQGQFVPCVGRLIATYELAVAEWRFGYADQREDPRVSKIRHELRKAPR